jgi:lipopolysaccharide export system permease protein
MAQRLATGEMRARLSPTVTRYMAKQFVLAFLAVFFVFIGVIFLIDTIELLRRSGGKEEATFGVVLSMAIFKLPLTAQKTLSFAVLFGAMFAFWRLNRSSELIALRAAGVSVWQFMLPVIIAALVLGAIKIAAVNPVAAIMIGRYEQLENRYLRRLGSLMAATSSGVWLRQSAENGPSVIHAATARVGPAELELGQVIVLHYRGQDEFAGRIDAERATLERGHWRLIKALITTPDQPGRVAEVYELKTDLTIDRIQNSFSSPSTVSFWELPRFIAALEATGFSALGHRLHWHSLVAEPMLYVAMILVAAVFSLRHNRRRGVLFAVAGGIATGFVLFFLSDLVLALAHSTRLPPLIAAWAPPLASALIGLAALMHAEDG